MTTELEEQQCTTCGDNSCGTGSWTGPKPGDPPMDSGHITLRAVPILGGIEVSWSWPTVNSSAVSHTKLFRGTTSDFNSAVELAIAAGNKYLDRIQDVQTYFYWIRMVSINGTEGELIGPVSATSKKIGTDIAEVITGEIDSGALAAELREKIDKITLNATEIYNEIQSRVASFQLLTNALADLQNSVDESFTLIHNSTNAWHDGLDAVVEQQELIAAGNLENAAAIATERETRVSEDEALANQINVVYAQSQDNAAAIISEQTARTDADTAQATQISQLFTASGNNAAAIQNEQTARTNADSSLASQISTTQTTLGNQISSVQTNATTAINAVDGKVNAMWTAKVDVNGMVGGFGLYNDSQTVEAGFDVDRFWVGRTTNKVKPFIINGTTTYLQNAMIQDAAITNAKIGNLEVGTIKIANGAITEVLGHSTSSTQYIDKFGNSKSAVTLTIPANTKAVLITYNQTISMHPDDISSGLYNGLFAEAWVTRSDSTQIGGSAGIIQTITNDLNAHTISGMVIDTAPISGSVTYYLSLRCGEGVAGKPNRVGFGPNILAAQAAKK